MIRVYYKGGWDELEKFSSSLALSLDKGSIQTYDPNTNDTFMLQYTINSTLEDENFKHFWSDEASHFLGILEKANTDSHHLVPVGRTIIFQAVVPDKVKLETLSAKEILTHFGVRNITLDRSQDVPGGRIWLGSVPVFRKEWQLEIDYLALCHKANEDEQTRYFHRSIFITPDLITHKANNVAANFRFMHQKENLDELIQTLKKNTKDIICSDAVILQERHQGLQELADNFDGLLETSLELIEFSNSLSQQQKNFSSSLSGIEDYKSISGPIWRTHADRIDSYLTEVELKRDLCQKLLDSANLAVNITQARINKLTEEREQKEESRRKFQGLLFTFIGVVFAVPQLLTFDTLAKVFLQLGWALQPIGVLLIQIALTLVLALTLVFIIRFITKRIRLVKV